MRRGFALWRFCRRFCLGAVICIALLAACPAFADEFTTPPIGYTGVVPHMPPVGYVGPVPHTPSAMDIAGPVIVPAPTLPNIFPSQTRDTEPLITADRLAFNQNANIATATGHVEIAYNGYVLHADKVTYNQNTNVMHAEGHVAILHPDGEVSFATDEDITGDMKDAYAHNLGVLFPDNSRLAAPQGERFQGRYLVADHGIYTACNVCKEDPNNPPIWQLTADEIVHDNVTHDIYYHDTTVDFFGVPVAYSPYLSGPDPTVDRRQGFLSPLVGYTPEAGYFMHMPYYFDIAPDKDAILSPTFSTNDIAMLGGEYRERFDQGKLTLDGSVGYSQLLSESNGEDKGDHLRYDVIGDFLDDINNIWRVGSQIDYISDKSYLERYDMGSPGQTTNRAFLEGFEGRDYVSVNSYFFQDLQPGTQPVQPVVLPDANFSFLGEPGQTLGGRWSLDGDMLVTARDDNNDLPQGYNGPQTRRLYLNGGWQRQIVSDTGLVTNLDALARSNAYWADDVPNINGDGQIFNNVAFARQFEQANVTESYPFARHGDGYQQIIEPMVMFTAAPVVHTPAYQPIEDSLNVQFDETNLFDPNRFTGDDLVEGGSRVTYGARQSFIADGGAHLDMFGGESYDFSPSNEFPALSGLNDNASDYVGRISASPGSWLDADWGFRFSQKDLSPEAEDAHVSFGTPLFHPSLRYVLAYQTETTGVTGVTEELIPGFSSTFAKYWTLAGSEIQAFQPDPGSRQYTIDLSYTDECLIVGTSAQYSNTNAFDLKSGVSVLFHIILRNVGGVRSDNFNSPHFNDQFRQTNDD